MKKITTIFCIIFSFGFYMANAQGDDCSTALQLNNVINYCSGSGAYTNVGSAVSSFTSPLSCWSTASTHDVWFSFTAVGTDILITASGSGGGGTMVRPRIAILSGSCGGTLSENGCAGGTAGSGITQLYHAPLVVGQTYYICISTTSAQEGTFELCVNNYTPSANPGADCGGAAYLCSMNPVSVGTLSGGGANANEPESTTCLYDPTGSEGNSSWFYWTCGTSGTLTFDLTPVSPTDDIDWLLYQLGGTNVCGSRTPIRCNSSSCLGPNGTTGINLTDPDITEDPNCDIGENAYCQYINMVAGTTYALLVNNWSANNGFTLDFGGSGAFLGPHPDISTNSTTICAGNTVTFDGSASTNVSGGLNWNFNNGGSPTTATGAGPHTVTYSSPGSYVAILTGQDGTGCSSTVVTNINVGNAAPAPTVANITYCVGDNASQLTATGTNLLWYTSATGGSGSATAPTPSTATAGTTSYYVSQTPSGCESPRAQIDVTVTTLPDASATSPVNLACVPNTVQLSGSSSTGGTTYSWAGPGVVSGGNTLTPTVNGAGTYTLTVSLGSCSNTATVLVNPPSGSPNITTPTANHNIDCINSTATLTSGSSTSNTSFAWTGPTSGTPAGTAPTQASTTVNASGTYTITVTDNSNGCTSVSSISVTANTTAPTVGAINSPTITCTTTTVTLSTSSANGNTFAWTGPTAGTPAGSTPTSSSTVVNAGGTYTVTVTNPSNGCTATGNATITTNTIAPVVNVGADQTITCASNSAAITGTVTPQTSGTAGYTWTGPSAGSPAGSTPTSSSTTVSAPGTYTLTGVDASNGCIASGTVAVTASTDLPNVTVGPNDTLTCIVNSATLTGNSTTSGVNYLWTGPTSIDTVGNTANVNVSLVGTYTLTVTDNSNGCSSSVQTAVLSNVTAPQVSVGASPLLSCVVPSVPITASSTTQNTTFAWTGPTGSTPAGSTPDNDTTYVTSGGTYTVTVTDTVNGCHSSSTILVSSNSSAVIVNAGPASMTLPCGSAGIALTPSQQQQNYSYAWTGPNGYSCPTFTGCTVTETGTYTLTATDNTTGCSSTDIVQVVAGTVPNAILSASTTSGYADLDVVYTNSSTGANNYQWFVNPPSSTLPVAVTHNYANTFTVPGNYTVILVAGNGTPSCNDTTYVEIEVKEYATVVIPNIFSPNADGTNDFLKPITTGMKELNVDIYNRWGTLIITFDGLGTGWDGSGNSEGTYFYIAKGTGIDGTAIEEKGFVLMVK